MSTSPAALPDVVREVERVPADIVRRASEYPSSILADVAGRRGALSGRIAPLAPTMRFAGPALTVEVRPGDNLMIHAALAIARPGDVIVVDGKGDLNSALMGEIMCQQAAKIGVVGVVIDGASAAMRPLSAPRRPATSARIEDGNSAARRTTSADTRSKSRTTSGKKAVDGWLMAAVSCRCCSSAAVSRRARPTP